AAEEARGDAGARRALQEEAPAAEQAKPQPPQPKPQTPAQPAPQPPTPPQPPAEFTRLMTQGQQAMAAKHYDEAVKAYTEALKLVPGDPEATKALHAAPQAPEGRETPPPQRAPQPRQETPTN